LSYNGRLTLVNSFFSALPAAPKFHPKSLNKYIFSKSTVCGVKVILIEEVHVLLHGKQPANQKLREAWA
jgi:hypothetical protein